MFMDVVQKKQTTPMSSDIMIWFRPLATGLDRPRLDRGQGQQVANAISR
jgi:hypothetical protein